MDYSKTFANEAVYQIYPRSFCDSNGDGIGDLNGITSKLDYLKELGVGIIWLSPIYKSPMFDMGYDIADYYSIDPCFGTMEDFDNLLFEANKRGLKIVMDLVVNHTSNQHPWFIESRKKDSPYHDFYYWREGKKNNKLPPNNWTSNFSGPAWTYDEEVGEWYLHLFAKEQPDLNWHCPKVIEEVENILRFYLDKGVYGFRCDVINQIWKNTLEDGKGHAPNGRGSEHYLCTEGNHKILRRFYDDVFSHYDCVVIGETFNVDPANGRKYIDNHELDMFFQFESVNVDRSASQISRKKFKASKFKSSIFSWQKAIDWNANYLENHDQPRSISRFGTVEKYWCLSAKALALLITTLRGTPFIYQGQEIGMLDYPGFDPRKSEDVSCRMIYELAHKGYHLPSFIAKKIADLHNRDHSRTPMQWSGELSAGFSSNQKTWLPLNPSYSYINVERELGEDDSILNFYKKALSLRREYECLRHGDFAEVKTKGSLIVFQRHVNGQECLVMINLSKKTSKVPAYLSNVVGKLALSNYGDSSITDLRYLRPYEALLIDLDQ